MNKKVALGQFYTPAIVASVLAEKTMEYSSLQEGVKVVELAAGEGSLLSALNDITSIDMITAVDIDNVNALFLKGRFPDAHVIVADAIGKKLDLVSGSFDIGLGNPPFLSYIEIDDFQKNMLMKELSFSLKGKKTKIEYLFLAQFFRLIKDGGILSIILPESIMSGVKSKDFRQAIINSYRIIEVVEVPGKAFSETEAKTHIVFFKKEKPKNNSKTILSKIFPDGGVKKIIEISQDQLVHRMDASYFMLGCGGSRVLSDYATVSRGVLSHKELRSLGVDFIHTTNIKDMCSKDFFKMSLATKEKSINQNQNAYAKSGDILICRVGSRVVGKAYLNEIESILISDCIIKVRFFTTKERDAFYDFIISDKGQKELQSLSRGVCSRYLTNIDLLNLKF